MKRGKKYLEAQKGYEKMKLYTLFEAVALSKKLSYAKFNATIDLALKTNLNQKKAEQNLRGSFNLPHGTGKTKKICAICDGLDQKVAKEAGADFVGEQELLDKIKKGWLEFDVMVATPKMMPKLGILGKVLGPRGLMPNPKTGTVTTDLKKAITEIKAGKIEFSVDKLGNIHIPVGLVSFEDNKLAENIQSFVKHINKLKPATVKGTYLKNLSISATMGPGIKIDLESVK